MDNSQFKEFMETFKSLLIREQTGSAVGTQSVTSPLILNFEPFKKETENFSQYLERFENFAEMKNIHNNTSLMKKTFLNYVGSETYDTLKAIIAPKSIKDSTYKEIVDALHEYLNPRPNRLIEGHRFHMRIQNEKETIGEYVAALRKFLPNCEFKCEHGSSVAELFLQFQFIRGIRDSSIREKLLQEGNYISGYVH